MPETTERVCEVCDGFGTVYCEDGGERPCPAPDCTWKPSAKRKRRPFRAGDHVHHGPTGEDWVLAVDEERGYVMPSGWPCTMAKAEQCTLLWEADDAERMRTLESWATASVADPRRSAARGQLVAGGA